MVQSRFRGRQLQKKELEQGELVRFTNIRSADSLENFDHKGRNAAIPLETTPPANLGRLLLSIDMGGEWERYCSMSMTMSTTNRPRLPGFRTIS